MKPFKKKLGALAGAAALMFGAAAAQASLVLVEPQDFSGTGLGSVNTILTLSSPANSSFESGSVAFGDVISGDAMTGSSQTQTRTLGELGVESASSLRVVFNALEPGNEDLGITLADLVLNIYSPSGDLLFTSGAFTPVNFADTFTGAGNSGFVFALDAEQQAAAAAAFGASFQDNVIGLSAAAGCTTGSPAGCLGATGGFETFFVANANGGPVPAIPEPETYALMLAGLGMVAFMLRRRSSR
ncbi:MAG TPA: PEP-CTERM sorting domain-containing protein [Albitalea sp.]